MSLVLQPPPPSLLWLLLPPWLWLLLPPWLLRPPPLLLRPPALRRARTSSPPVSRLKPLLLLLLFLHCCCDCCRCCWLALARASLLLLLLLLLPLLPLPRLPRLPLVLLREDEPALYTSPLSLEAALGLLAGLWSRGLPESGLKLISPARSVVMSPGAELQRSAALAPAATAVA